MTWRWAAAALLAGLPLFQTSAAQTIALAEEDATVWAQTQVVRGTTTGAASGTLRMNGTPIPFEITNGAFAAPVRLTAPVTTLVACVPGPAGDVCSAPLVWTLGYRPRPEVEVRASVEGRQVRFAGHVLGNPAGGTLAFTWAEVPGNPGPIGLTATGDSAATASLPADAPPGEYTVAWTARAADGGERTARTFVTVGPDGTVTPFVIETDRAAWIRQATVYEVTPRHFPGLYRGSFDVVRQKLPELVALGVNTLWLQPVYPTTDEDQGYSVLDFFGVRDDLGGEQDLRDLIDAAHALGLRVLFDFVPNHSAIQHPYAEDAIAHGARSHYYDFYQRTRDSGPYSGNERTRTVGQMTFVYYFYNELVNFDYDNPEVQRFIVEASRHWVEDFGVDGFRFDAVWGVQARNPAFTQAWRLALKRVRPDLFLLAEAKATDASLFDARFDAAYDWAANPNCISQWAWQRACGSTTTLFNSGLEQYRARDLRSALTNRGAGYAPDALVLRYLENNDTDRFFRNHTAAQDKMAAGLLFALPGVPMLYYGQEAGARVAQYDYPSYSTARTIASYDTQGFFLYYQQLLRDRAAFSALTGDGFAEVPVSPADVSDQTFAFRRWADGEHVVAAVNMGDAAVAAVLALPVGEMRLDPATTYYLTDLVTGEAQSGTGADLAAVTVRVPPFTTRMFAVADAVVTIPTSDEPSAPVEPARLTLEPNLPNPFSGATTIPYTVARPGPVRLAVYDVLGREVALLVDGEGVPGRHTTVFDGSAFASGVYVCRIESGGQTATRRLVIAR